MYSETLLPGSWPPSPGLAPCAILICSISALARYSVVTPKRPEATCLILDLSESPSRRRISTSTRVFPSLLCKDSPALIGAYRLRRPGVLLAAHPPGVLTAGVEHGLEDRVVLVERRAMDTDRFLGHVEHVDALDVRGGAGEVFVDQRSGQPDGLEDLRPGVRHVGRDPHLGHDLLQALADPLYVALNPLRSRGPVLTME